MFSSSGGRSRCPIHRRQQQQQQQHNTDPAAGLQVLAVEAEVAAAAAAEGMVALAEVTVGPAADAAAVVDLAGGAAEAAAAGPGAYHHAIGGVTAAGITVAVDLVEEAAAAGAVVDPGIAAENDAADPGIRVGADPGQVPAARAPNATLLLAAGAAGREVGNAGTAVIMVATSSSSSTGRGAAADQEALSSSTTGTEAVEDRSTCVTIAVGSGLQGTGIMLSQFGAVGEGEVGLALNLMAGVRSSLWVVGRTAVSTRRLAPKIAVSFSNMRAKIRRSPRTLSSSSSSSKVVPMDSSMISSRSRTVKFPQMEQQQQQTLR